MKPFDYAFEQTLCLEEGYSDDPADRGGKTNWGITEATLKDACTRGIVPTRDVASLSKDQARLIYKAEYWDALKLDSVISPAIVAEIFDTEVNMGRSAAVKIIQEALNYLGESLAVDGVMGMKTLAALNKWSSKDERALFVCLNGFQFMRYVGIVEMNASQKRFSRGWTKRIQTYKEG
ncbi:Predicted Peptidoglycan domain-containing protein [Syntrophus gentianae]|uniref:Predicted Peptidoglycan domain-containing protein n=1 Tax=Syntrophus gentianae TaxID=43775 RepID=A0A1H8B7L4_9BACT|nr:N-acetylmuramidase [Syntrophus gentianae]SEM78941.1 Predicted Peptidoglycan domain-containing protein [Syntrophus gentianae]